jgi:hypothetical protein
MLFMSIAKNAVWRPCGASITWPHIRPGPGQAVQRAARLMQLPFGPESFFSICTSNCFQFDSRSKCGAISTAIAPITHGDKVEFRAPAHRLSDTLHFTFFLGKA